MDPESGLAKVGEIDRLDVWMSAAATPSALTVAMRSLTALALAAMAAPASLPVVVTPSVTRAKSGVAEMLAVAGDLERAVLVDLDDARVARRDDWRGGGLRERERGGPGQNGCNVS